MRRSKRKASAVATENINRASAVSAADTSATNVTEPFEEEANVDTCEEGDVSDDETLLHGPCNIRPCDSDEHPRFVLVIACRK